MIARSFASIRRNPCCLRLKGFVILGRYAVVSAPYQHTADDLGLGVMQMDTDHNSQGRYVRLVVSQFCPSSALVLSANRANRDVIFCWRYPVSLQAHVPNP